MNGYSSRRNRLSVALVLTVFLPLAYLGFGCSEDLGVQKENQPPTVWLSSAPPEGSVSSYTVHLFWGGWDPDGEIAYYEYAISDNETGFFDPADTVGSDKWFRVYSNDSTFMFSADILADSSDLDGPLRPLEYLRSHTFFIRAVDREGLATPEPAYRSFTARTLSPTVEVKIPVYTGLNAALLPPITKFTWEGKDYVDNVRTSQDPDSVRWILLSTEPFEKNFEKALAHIQQHPNDPQWSEWNYYRAPLDTGKSWTTPPLDFGGYMFAVQVKDEAGAISPVFDEKLNVRRVIISKRTTGPLLIMRNQYIGTLKSTTATTAFTIVDLPAGVPLIFEWSARAEHYGGVVAGYRYGWDITDFKIDEQWDVDWTPIIGSKAKSPPRTHYFGTHTFHVEVMDNSGFKSRVNIKMNIVPFEMNKNLLIVDDYREDPRSCGLAKTNGAVPCDDEHDAFWSSMVQNLDGFDSQEDMIEVSTDFPLPIFTLAQYKSVIWDTYGGYAMIAARLPFLYELIKYLPKDPQVTVIGKVQPNLLALFLAAGGHVLVCGEQPMTMVFNPQFTSAKRFPFIFQYELMGDQSGDYEDQVDNPVGDQSFTYLEMCLDVLDIAYTGYSSLRRAGESENGCGVTHLRGVRPKEDGLREAMPIDLNFPLMTLRPEVAGFGRFYAPESRGLNGELYNPPYFSCGNLDLGPRACFEPIYGHGCLDTKSNIYGAPNAAWTLTFADVVPEVPGGIAARSAVWGFEPFFFDTTSVRLAIEEIVFDEWQLPRK